MTEPTTPSLGAIVARLDDLRTDVKDLRTDLRDQASAKVARTEWEQRNHHVDDRFQSLGREVGQLRTELQQRRVSWPAVLGSLASSAAVALAVVVAINR